MHNIGSTHDLVSYLRSASMDIDFLSVISLELSSAPAGIHIK